MAAHDPAQQAKTEIECVVPILRVREIHRSLEYYVKVLGFGQDWLGETDGGVMAGVSRDRLAVYLCQGEQGHSGTWVWIGVSDVEALHEEYRASGAKIRQEPTSYPWALEMKVEDPDGHVLRFGSEPREP